MKAVESNIESEIQLNQILVSTFKTALKSGNTLTEISSVNFSHRDEKPKKTFYSCVIEKRDEDKIIVEFTSFETGKKSSLLLYLLRCKKRTSKVLIGYENGGASRMNSLNFSSKNSSIFVARCRVQTQKVFSRRKTILGKSFTFCSEKFFNLHCSVRNKIVYSRHKTILEKSS